MEPFAATLTDLIARWSCGIDDAGLRLAQNITKLDASGDSRITTVAPWSSALKILAASRSDRLTDAGLRFATGIVTLRAENTRCITTVTPMAQSLTELDASGALSCITNAGLQIVKLNASHNPAAINYARRDQLHRRSGLLVVDRFSIDVPRCDRDVVTYATGFKIAVRLSSWQILGRSETGEMEHTS